MRTKKTYSNKFKFELVIESIKKDEIIGIARKHGINHSLLSIWKKAFLENGKEIFSSNDNKEKKELESKVANLERIIGKKEVELNLLKNFSDFYESKNGM